MKGSRSTLKRAAWSAGFAFAWAACCGAQAEVVLDADGTCWRWISARRPAVVASENASDPRKDLKGKTVDAAVAGTVDTPPPAGWPAVAFDDADWPRGAGRRLENLVFVRDSMDLNTGALAGYFRQGLLCMRGKFRVNDTASVKALRLSVSYRGGIVVHLNGREVARKDLPAGPLTPATAATAYPPTAYLTPDDKLLPEPRRVKPDDGEILRRIASRDRALGPIDLPTDLLRKGVNVLAVQVHRSDFDRAAARYLRKYTRAAWNPLAVTALRLEAEGGGIAANTSRPAGVQVWNQDRNDRAGPDDYGDPCEPLRPMVLTAARNGVFSAKVVVGSDRTISSLRAVAGPLKRLGGSEVIDGRDVRVRYSPPLPDRPRTWVEPLSAVAPPGAVTAVWVTVRVPADAVPGQYRGMLAISAGGSNVADAAVHLRVADWRIPDPKDFRTFVGLYQLPLALARKYTVGMWSEEHWRLMDRSFDLLGQLGNRLVQIPIVDQTKLGNEDGMVTWIRRPDGSFDHDFTVLERYLKLVKRRMRVPKFAVVHLWHAGGWRPAGAAQKNTVTVVDPATGKREHMQVPEFGTAEAKAFWKPVLGGIRQRLAAEGMAGSFCLGSLCEKYPPKAVNQMFTELLGDASWMRITHASHGALSRPNRPLAGGGRVALHAFTYLPALPGPAHPLPPLHRPHWPRAAYFRRAQGTGLSLIGHRLLPATALYRRLPGFAHACLDYWKFPKLRNHRGGMLYGRWPHASNYPGDPEPPWLVWPGPDGPEPMAAFEALREGLQEAEALIALSEALDAKGPPLRTDLARRCRRVLADYLAYCRTRNQMRYQYVFRHMNHYGWRGLSERLFSLAAEVSKSGRAGGT